MFWQSGREDPQADPADETSAVEQRQLERKENFRAAIEKKDFDKAVGILEEMITDKEVNDEERVMAQFFQFRIFAEEQLDGAKACPIAKKRVRIAEGRRRVSQLSRLDYPRQGRAEEPRLRRPRWPSPSRRPRPARTRTRRFSTRSPALTLKKSDIDKAIEVQTLAIEQCDAEDQPEELKPHLNEMKPDLEKSLEKYKAEKETAGKGNCEEKKEAPKPEEPEEGEEV